MRLIKRILWAAALSGVVGTAGPAGAASLALGPSSRLWITGDSTLHVWHSTATALKPAIEVQAPQGAASFYEGVRDGQVKRFELTIPVDGMKSGESLLDSKMRSALHRKRYPDIVFRLRDYRVEPAGPGLLKILAHGTLAVSGTEKQIDLQAEASPDGDGTARVRGSYDLLMTDYGVKPPKLMMGALKTADKVSVHYDLELRFVP